MIGAWSLQKVVFRWVKLEFYSNVKNEIENRPGVYKITQPVSFKDINLNAQLKFYTEYKMETWFWILSWILSILTITGNGFTVLLVRSRRRLRTKTNALIVSLAVADFCVGAFVVPSLFFCHNRGGCIWPGPYSSWVDFTRWLFAYASTMNLCSLTLDRYMAVAKPLKYVTFMTARRVIQLTFFSWFMPVCLVLFSFFWDLYVTFPKRRMVLNVCFALLEIFFTCMLIFCFISVVTVVYKQTRSSAILAKQLRFNHSGLTINTHDKSAVVMLAIVVGFALVCFAVYFRCTLLMFLGKNSSCPSDVKYKIPMLVLNSAINPLAYAFFKRDIKRAVQGK